MPRKKHEPRIEQGMAVIRKMIRDGARKAGGYEKLARPGVSADELRAWAWDRRVMRVSSVLKVARALGTTAEQIGLEIERELGTAPVPTRKSIEEYVEKLTQRERRELLAFMRDFAAMASNPAKRPTEH